MVSSSMETAFENLLKQKPDLSEIIAVPLYPHYAMSSYETAVEHAREVYATNQYSFDLKFVKPYYNEDHYISALSKVMAPYLEPEVDHLLFSYHGVPGRHIRKSDPTGNHCSGNCKLLQPGLAGTRNLLPAPGFQHHGTGCKKIEFAL